MMKKVRWGVLSTANIAVRKVIPAMQRGAHTVVTAIASRDGVRAEAAARTLGLSTAYASYEALLADPDVDAVYIPLPNHLHVPWAVRALEAGKHVLCEKPIALTADEASVLDVEAARHPSLVVMEAFMYRFHPQWVMAHDIVRQGGIGELRAIDTFFSYRDLNPQSIHNQQDVGGGGVLDIGCYPISLSRFLFGAEPQRVAGATDVSATFGVDVLASAVLQFPQGHATFICSTEVSAYQRVQIVGTAGRVEIEVPFNAPPDEGHRLWHTRGGETTVHDVGYHDQYTIQGDLFSRAVIEGTRAPTPLSDAVANMKVIDALFESARSGRWIPV